MSLSMSLAKPKDYKKNFDLKRYVPDLQTSIKHANKLILQAKNTSQGKIILNKHSVNLLEDTLDKITEPFDDAATDIEDEWESGGETDLGIDIGYGHFDFMREDLLVHFGGKVVNKNDPFHEYYHCDDGFPPTLWTFITKKDDAEGSLTYSQCVKLYNLLKSVKLKNPERQETLKQVLSAFKQAKDSKRGLVWC